MKQKTLLSRVWTGWAEKRILEWVSLSTEHNVASDNVTYEGLRVHMLIDSQGTWVTEGAVEFLRGKLKKEFGITVDDIIAKVDYLE